MYGSVTAVRRTRIVTGRAHGIAYHKTLEGFWRGSASPPLIVSPTQELLRAYPVELTDFFEEE